MKTKQLRVASYLRVSHEEQKKHGDSIATQRDHIKKYFENNPNAIHIGEYCDEGISADKLKRRLELQRLLVDIQEGKIDLVIFTKLDRWFRSVAKYYKIQEILEENNVAWQTLLEEYETVTSSGKFKVNIMLSVAQQERDRDSDRIKDVFEYKVRNGQAITGTQPFPFMVKEIDGVKRVVHNPDTEAMTYDWLNHLKTYNSMRASAMYINEKYDKHIDYNAVIKLAKNPLLYGSYKGNDNYCQGYITKQEFKELQEALKKNIRVKKSQHVHLFSRMIKCPSCGSNLVGCTNRYTVRGTGEIKITYTLRCENRYKPSKVNKPCTFKPIIHEKAIEEYLLENITKHIENYISSLEVKAPKKEVNDVLKQKKKIKDEMERLNIMFQKNRISMEQYDESYEELENKLKKLGDEQPKKDISKLKKLLEYNFIEQYKRVDKNDKRAFWNAIIKEIHIDKYKNITDIIFW